MGNNSTARIVSGGASETSHEGLSTTGNGRVARTYAVVMAASSSPLIFTGYVCPSFASPCVLETRW